MDNGLTLSKFESRVFFVTYQSLRIITPSLNDAEPSTSKFKQIEILTSKTKKEKGAYACYVIRKAKKVNMPRIKLNISLKDSYT